VTTEEATRHLQAVLRHMSETAFITMFGHCSTYATRQRLGTSSNVTARRASAVLHYVERPGLLKKPQMHHESPPGSSC